MLRFTIRDLLWLTVVVAFGLVAFRQQIQRTLEQPTLALDGYCSVTVSMSRQWQEGNPAYQTVFEDQIYLFASSVEQQVFLSNPQRFAVRCSGNDVVRLSDEGVASRGSLRFGMSHITGMYLFDSEKTLARFESHPEKYIEYAMQERKEE